MATSTTTIRLNRERAIIEGSLMPDGTIAMRVGCGDIGVSMIGTPAELEEWGQRFIAEKDRIVEGRGVPFEFCEQGPDDRATARPVGPEGVTLGTVA